MKDHELANLHNEIRGISVKFHDHQCLRELIVKALKPLVEENRELQLKENKPHRKLEQFKDY